MTAIVSVHTPDGFIVGADGRRLDLEKNDIHLAYGWTGSTEGATRETVAYDFRKASEAALPLAAALNGGSFSTFVDVFVWGLRNKIPVEISNLPSSDFELAKVLLIGFFASEPCRAEIAIRYLNSVLSPRIELEAPVGYYKAVFTSAESAYLNYAASNPDSRTLAIEFVRGYIQNCIDSDAPDCAGIGGHLHIAEISTGHIAWVIPPAS